MSAAMMVGIIFGSSSDAQAAQNFNNYSEGLSEQVTNVPQIVGYVSYLGGFVLAALGVVGLKQHVENPGQNPMKNALAKLGFGGMLLALPPVVAAIQGSGNASGSGSTAFTSFTPSTGLAP